MLNNSSGFLDFISRTVQGLIWSEPFLAWITLYLDQQWIWLDPSATNGVPMLPYVLSHLMGAQHTTTLSVVIGAVIGISIVLILWKWYLNSK